MNKVCSLCDEEYELRWPRSKPRVQAPPLGIGSLCPKCKPKADRKKAAETYKGRNMLKKYGITLGDYYEMMFNQSGNCKICGKPSNGNKLSIDHDHSTGKIRGLLCLKCNVMIGMAGDRPDILINGADYLKNHK